MLLKNQKDFVSCITIRKTVIASILKDAMSLRNQYQFFRSSCKINRVCKYIFINEVLCTWYGKCCAAGIYLCETILQEKALKINNQLDEKDLGFTALRWFYSTQGLVRDVKNSLWNERKRPNRRSWWCTCYHRQGTDQKDLKIDKEIWTKKISEKWRNLLCLSNFLKREVFIE